MESVPVVVVFTQYDRLVRTKQKELANKVDASLLDQLGKEEAQKAFASCEQSLKQTMERLKTPMPNYLQVSSKA
jgi:GTP-binding protein EngB required for normal cell division